MINKDELGSGDIRQMVKDRDSYFLFFFSFCPFSIHPLFLVSIPVLILLISQV